MEMLWFQWMPVIDVDENREYNKIRLCNGSIIGKGKICINNKYIIIYNAIQLSIISVVFCHREPLFFMPKNFKNITKNS